MQRIYVLIKKCTGKHEGSFQNVKTTLIASLLQQTLNDQKNIRLSKFELTIMQPFGSKAEMAIRVVPGKLAKTINDPNGQHLTFTFNSRKTITRSLTRVES